MTKEEADKVASVIAKADGGCPVCVGVLIEDITRVFPEFDWSKLVSEQDAY